MQNLKTLEGEYFATRPRLSDKQWLLVFPDSKKRIRELIRGYDEEIEKLDKEIRDDLNAIYDKSDDSWFAEKIIEIWKGKKLDNMIKKIRRLKASLVEFKSKQQVSELEIQIARDHPFEMLVKEIRKNWALCNFHLDKRPSLYIRKRDGHSFAYCFVCGRGWDPIAYVMERDGLTFVEAVRKLQ